MELRHIRYFVRAAELLHFTNAAESLYISQPALSSHIHQLEAELGMQLFDRVGRHVRLTEAGMRFLAHARIVLREVEAASQEIAALQGLQLGTIHMGALMSFGQEMLPTWISTFHEKHPKIGISVCTGTSDALEDEVLDGKIELALSFATQNAQLSFEKLFTQEACLVVAQTHPLAHREVVEVEEIAAVPLAFVTKRWAARRLYDALFAKHNLAPDVLIEIDDLRALVSLVRTGTMGTILGRVTVGEAQDLRFIPIANKPLMTDYGVLWNKQTHLSLAANAFLEHLRSWSAAPPTY